MGLADKTVSVEGLRELEKSFDILETHVQKRAAARKILKKGAAPFVSLASMLAPDDPTTTEMDLKDLKVGTQLTKRQKRMERRNRREKGTVWMYAGVNETANEYAHMVEFGTINMEPRPFMRQAWSGTRNTVLKTIIANIKKEVDAAAKRAERARLRKLAKG